MVARPAPSGENGPMTDESPVDADEGGDPACWQNRVCPACGGLAEADPPVRCPRCGADIPEP